MPLEAIAVDFTADLPCDTLVHCHRQLHTNLGYVRIIKCNVS
jgi:hypothetical protein